MFEVTKCCRNGFKEMINIKYHILLSFASKAELIRMFDTLVDEHNERKKKKEYFNVLISFDLVHPSYFFTEYFIILQIFLTG